MNKMLVFLLSLIAFSAARAEWIVFEQETKQGDWKEKYTFERFDFAREQVKASCSTHLWGVNYASKILDFSTGSEQVFICSEVNKLLQIETDKKLRDAQDHENSKPKKPQIKLW